MNTHQQANLGKRGLTSKADLCGCFYLATSWVNNAIKYNKLRYSNEILWINIFTFATMNETNMYTLYAVHTPLAWLLPFSVVVARKPHGKIEYSTFFFRSSGRFFNLPNDFFTSYAEQIKFYSSELNIFYNNCVTVASDEKNLNFRLLAPTILFAGLLMTAITFVLESTLNVLVHETGWLSFFLFLIFQIILSMYFWQSQKYCG